jgi:hypothetical protein
MPSDTRLRYLGYVRFTSEAVRAFDDSSVRCSEFFNWDVIGDWSEVVDDVQEGKRQAIQEGGLIISVYRLSSGQKLLAVTEGHASDTIDINATMVMLPEEF